MTKEQAACGLKVPHYCQPLPPSGPSNHSTGTRQREARLLTVHDPKKGKNINEHGVHKSAEQALIIRKHVLSL